MPLPAPIPAEKREAILADICGGILGRSAIARMHGVSAGTVTNLARAVGAFFPRCVDTVTATHARRVGHAAARIEREAQLWDIYLATPLRGDGRETRRVQRTPYALYNLNRKSPRSH